MKEPVASLSRLELGGQLIRDKVRILPNAPGCYRMMNSKGDVLYVGKAKDLRKRVHSYTQIARLSNRLQRMVGETIDMEFVQTHTEAEALLLEANLIKRYQPYYNVLLRDDKSFPFILLTQHPKAPQILKHRGAKDVEGEFFGPFASAGAVNRTIIDIERAFLLRSCSDSIFESRTRPCLQYQIKRCSAPCVDRIAPAEYNELVNQARNFLRGKSSGLKERLSKAMLEASEARDYERAAQIRDRLNALAQIQAHQSVYMEEIEEADILALHREGAHSCIQVFFFRNHGNYGNRAYFPSHDKEATDGEILSAFIAQFYSNKIPPRCLLLNCEPDDKDILAEALSLRAQKRVELHVPQRGPKRKPVDQAVINAKEALARRKAESSTQAKLFSGLADLFGMNEPPKRVEVYDNSHISGTNTYGVMIVAGPEGFRKNQYRKFSLKDAEITPGDDYGMMRHVLTRRFARALKEDPERKSDTWPELVLIDGGLGQLNAALDVFVETGITEICIAAIAKGPDRNAGHERFFLPHKPPFSLDAKDPILFFLQRLRDEAHRFAIGTHRAKRSAQIGQSLLDRVPGIGAKRKKALLLHFGSARAVEQAGLTDLMRVPGINEKVAQQIYRYFHETS